MTTTTRKGYNGHPSRNYWNVSLWINNDEGLYRLALDCIKSTRRPPMGHSSFSARRRAAMMMLDGLITTPNTVPTTPDGAPYTVASIMHAMRGMER